MVFFFAFKGIGKDEYLHKKCVYIVFNKLLNDGPFFGDSKSTLDKIWDSTWLTNWVLSYW